MLFLGIIHFGQDILGSGAKEKELMRNDRSLAQLVCEESGQERDYNVYPHESGFVQRRRSLLVVATGDLGALTLETKMAD
jgi:hypothetical protein